MTSLLGIDIGGTKVAVRLETAAGECYEATRLWTLPADIDADMAVLSAAVTEVITLAGEPPSRVGVSLPATTDAEGIIRAWPGRSIWVGLAVRTELERVCGMPVVCADDGDLAALAESRRSGSRNLLYLGVGTGLGGGLVYEGRMVPGPGRGSCEVGHVVIRADGNRCDCGRAGCAQAYASGPAMLRRAAKESHRTINPSDLAEGWRAGAAWARTALGEGAETLALLVHAVHELAPVDNVVIGGGFPPAHPGFTELIAARVRAHSRAGRSVPPLQPAKSGLSSLDGAVCLAARPGPWPT